MASLIQQPRRQEDRVLGNRLYYQRHCSTILAKKKAERIQQHRKLVEWWLSNRKGADAST